MTLTPHTAALLRVAATMLRDDLADRDGFNDGRDPTYDLYPRIVLQHADDEWWHRMAGCYDLLIRALDVGEGPSPQCTGDAVALWNTINRAARMEAQRQAGAIDWAPIEDLPSEEDDYDWEMLRDLLFRDTDFLALWRPMDGIEDPDDEVNRNFGIGEHLIPAHWFDRFG